MVELVVVVAIIGILAAMGTVGYRRYQASARDAGRISKLSQLRSLLLAYRAENESFPPNPVSGLACSPSPGAGMNYHPDCLKELGAEQLEVFREDPVGADSGKSYSNNVHYILYYLYPDKAVIDINMEAHGASTCAFPEGGWCDPSVSRYSYCLCLYE